MDIFTRNLRRIYLLLFSIVCLGLNQAQSQALAFPGAQGFGRFAPGARGAAAREVYIVTTLNDSGTGSFRDAVSKSGRVVVFAVGGIVNLLSDVVVASNVTIAAQTAPGDGIVFFNKRVTFTGADNTICRYLRVRLGATNNSGNDASGLAHGSNIVFDHMSVTWGMDENFSINWDSKGSPPDNITIQNSIIGQALHRENHSAGGLIQTPDGGKVSLIQNLYISNKTRNPKVKGVNEFVNNVVYNWGNGNRLGDNLNYGWSGDAYIMGGSSGVSEVNIINNYFVGGPLTPPDKTTPFSRGTGTFNVYGAGNYFDNNKDGSLNGSEVPFDSIGYPGISGNAFKNQPFAYPEASPALSASAAYQYVIDNAGSNYPRRDQVDAFMIDEVASRGTKGHYVYRETDLPLSNGGLGDVSGAPSPLDTDKDGMPDAWEDANGLNKNDKADAVAFNASAPQYMNIEVYVNSLTSVPAADFVKAPSAVTLTATSAETPAPNSTIVVKWKDNSDNELNFVLERSTDGVAFTDIAHPAANAITYTDNAGLVPNKTYYYRLKAVTGTDVSAYSVVVPVLTPQITSAPAVPASPSPANGYQYASLTAGKITLKWTGSSNTVTYSIYFGTDPANLVKQADIAFAAAPSYQVPLTLANNTVYYWRINAVNAKGTTTGNVWSFKTEKLIPTGMVGYYAFDETSEAGNKVIDSTAYANTGFLGIDGDNQGVRVTGKLKNGLDFATADPSIYVVNIPNQDQLFLDKSSFSISFWMKAPASLLPPDNNTSSYLLCKGSISRNASTGATGKRFDIEFKNKQFRFALDDDNDAGGGGKDELATDGTAFFTNNWVHVVVIRDVTAKKLMLYRNGALVTTFNITKSNAGIGEASALVLGNIGELEFLAATNKPAPYKGMLDEVRIYNYVLPISEISALSAVKNTQTISFAPLPEKKAGDADFAPGATATSGLAVSYVSSNTNVATIVNGNVHIVAAGTATIIASQAGNASYNAAPPVSQALVVTKKDQAITFNAIAAKIIGDADFDPAAVSSAGLGIVYNSSDTTVATIVNGLVKINAAGTATITASQPGDDVYNAAAAVSQVLTVNKKDQAITFNAIAAKTIGDADFDPAAVSSSGLGIVYSSSDTTVATIVNGLVKINAAGNATITASQAGDDVYNAAAPVSQVLSVNKKDQAITFNAIAAKTMGDADFDAGAIASSGLLVSYTSSNDNVASISNGKIHITGAGTAVITAQQNGDSHYSAAPAVAQAFTVNKVSQSVTFGPLAKMHPGDADALLSASASSGLAISYHSNNENVATILNGKIHVTGAGSALIEAEQSGNGTYAAASASQLLIVSPYDLKVLYQDGDNGQLSNNSIKPFIKIVNQDSVAVAYNELTLRYWITPENYAGINSWIDYAQIGNNKVTMKYVPLVQPLNGALGYIEYGFNAPSAMLLAGSNSGVIQSRLSNKDYAVFNEADDHSFQPGAGYLANSKISMYRNGSLIWGTEPAAAVPVLKLKVLSENKNNNTGSNSISTTLVISNEGNTPVSYQDLSVRYWFTSEGTSPLNYWIDYAKLGSNQFLGQFIKPGAFNGADTYFEIKAKPELGLLYPLSNTGNIQYRIAKSNWSAFNEADDHSFKPKAAIAENAHITIYYKGQLIYGTEPSAPGPATVLGAQLSELITLAGQEGINAYPNPSHGNVKLKVNTKENGKITLSIYNAAGMLVHTVNDVKDGGYQKDIDLTQLAPGTYIVRVAVGGFVQSKTIIVN